MNFKIFHNIYLVTNTKPKYIITTYSTNSTVINYTSQFTTPKEDEFEFQNVVTSERKNKKTIAFSSSNKYT